MIKRVVALTGAACILLLPAVAQAYIGPGAGASLAGSLVAVLAAIATAVAIVLFWPLRLLYKKIRGPNQAAADSIVTAEDGQHTTSPGAAE
jgi:hypothetical protein